MKITTITLVALLGMSATANATSFKDNFNKLSERNWTISEWEAPGKTPNHTGNFSRDNVTIVDGYLRLQLSQSRDARGKYTSSGGEISTVQNFGYGDYEFRMRAGTTSLTPNGPGKVVRGAVSAAFVYAPNAITEIDIEFESNERRNATHVLSWIGQNYKRDKEHTQLMLPGPGPADRFYTYRIEWRPGMITYFRDGKQIARHTKKIPSTSGKMLFNHWGSHNEWWGGWASPGETRYAYVDYFEFTPFSAK